MPKTTKKPTNAEVLLNAWNEAPREIPLTIYFRKASVVVDWADFGYITLTADAARDLAAEVAERVKNYPLVYRPLKYLPGLLRALADRADGLGRVSNSNVSH